MKRKLFIISLVCVWYLASINGLIFDRQSAFDDFYPPTHINPLQEHPSHTIIDCARSCDRNQNCSSFFYLDADLPTCQLHEVVWNSTAAFNAVNGSKYYKVREPTIPYYPYTGCPVQGEYTPVSLSDGSVFTYKVSTVTANFTEAAAACALDGAELSKVYTPPKLDMIFQIRNDCYGSSAIWIDGNNIEATDFYDLTQWVTKLLIVCCEKVASRCIYDVNMRRRHQYSNIDDLFLTVSNGNLEGLKNYLKNGGNVNLKDATQVTLLHKAVADGDLEKTKLLIEYKCSLDLEDDHGCTPVYVAIDNNQHNILELLVNSGACVNAYVDHTTPLMLAVMKEDLKSVNILVDTMSISDIKTKNYIGQSALTQAILTNNVTICDILLQNGATLTGNSSKSFSKKIAHQLCTNLDMLKIFLYNKEPKNLRYLLLFSCSYKLMEAAKLILFNHDKPFHFEALGFLTDNEEESIWKELIHSVIQRYKLATKCSENNNLLEMLLSFCHRNYNDVGQFKYRAKYLIRKLVTYGLVIHPMTRLKSCNRDCSCRSIIFTALHELDPVPSLRAQCCSVIRQSLLGTMFFDVEDVKLLLIPKTLQDYICMTDL
ncbi:hypothetical protein ACF0H5_005174 [Mactra antiquata]